MTNTSPGLRSRFAGIELELQLDGKPPRKPISKSSSYHGLNSPSFTTPCKSPELSTAKRADWRSSSTSLKGSAGMPHASKRPQPNTVKSSIQGSPFSNKEDRTSKSQDLLQFSFMRDTSSSRKKQSIVASLDKLHTHIHTQTTPSHSHSHTLNQTQVASHPDLAHRKSYLYHTGKKRILLKSSQPADITNNYLSTSTSLNFERLAAFPKGHTGSEYKSNQSNKEDVYTRLYKSAPKSRERIADNRSDRLVNEPNDLRRKIDSTKRINNDSRDNLLEMRPSKSLDPKAQKVTKIATLDAMCLLVHQSDSSLFQDSHSLDLSLVPNTPIQPQTFLDSPAGKDLSIYERGEIMRSSAIYYVPELYSAAKRKMEINFNNCQNNYGFDDLRGNYIIRMNDHIDYRYEIIKTLGNGSFGSVVLCVDHKYANEKRVRKVAVKIIKNKLNWSLQAVSEIKVLKGLMKALNGPFEDNILNYCDHFHFRGHMCIVTEALSMNLFQFSTLNGHRGVSLNIARFLLRKILEGMEFIHKMNIVHCDIKPENIMLLFPPDYSPLQPQVSYKTRVKIIDFGSSCVKTETIFSYIQSRFYRAPEVILGTDYGAQIDLWSLGCLAAEIFSGSPLLPGKSEVEQISLFVELFGAPSSRYVLRERKMLLKSMQNKVSKALANTLAAEPSPFIPSQLDERKLKRTPLFSLFGIDGKINLQALNLQLLAANPDTRETNLQSPNTLRRNVKVSSRSLDVTLRLATSDENRQDQLNFSKFLTSVFRWDPKERPNASQLLESPFMEIMECS